MAILAQLLVIGLLIWIGVALLWVVFKIVQFIVQVVAALLMTGVVGWLVLEFVSHLVTN